MVEGPSGLLAISPPWNRPIYEPSKRRLTWPKYGAVATTYSADEPRSLRGPEHDSAWADELAHWQYLDDAWDNLQFGLRRGDPKCIVTSSPRALAFLRDLERESDTITTVGHTLENAHNLPAKFLRKIMAKYAGTRLGRQELEAEILTDNPAALWTSDLLDRCRVEALPEDIIRLVIGVDPAVSSNKKKSDETGIIGGALCECRCSGVPEQHAFLFDDRSGIYKPNEWGKKVVEFYDETLADLVAAEVNNGGELVERNLRATAGGERIAYKAIHASKGKQMRHEPVSNLYEQGLKGRVHHVGRLSRLEDQQMQWDPTQGGSPDRLDAATIVVTELMLGEQRETAEVGVTVIG
jgi:phage terminase large subunit-like protein